MAADYHHTVIASATPFRDFTKWCLRRETSAVDIRDIRRDSLRAYINQHFARNVTAFAKAVSKPQSQIADMLDKRKSFGEKVARDLTERVRAAKLPPIELDSASGSSTYDRVPQPMQVRETQAAYQAGWPFAFDRSRFDGLPEKLKGKIEGMVERMILEYEERAQTRRKSRRGLAEVISIAAFRERKRT